jgi:hypothetical protein
MCTRELYESLIELMDVVQFDVLFQTTHTRGLRLVVVFPSGAAKCIA